jgi:septal ring factor EnvC (AmiA/AmiB activator)
MKSRRYFLHSLAALALLAGLVRADQGPAVESPPVGQTSFALQKEQSALRTELDVLAARSQETQRRLITRGRAMYRLVRVGILPVGGGLGALFEHAARVERTRRALEQDLTETKALADRKVALLRKLGEVSTRQAQLDVDRDGLVRASAPLDADSLDSMRSSLRIHSDDDGANLQPSDPARSSQGIRPSRGDAPSVEVVGGFRGMKGRLPLPLNGRADIRRVRRLGASGPGLELVAPAGTAVRAVYPGRVAFADRYDAFGSVVILDHGDHFYTLMGDLGSMDVRVGDDLSAGARIGTVGSASIDKRSDNDVAGGSRRSSALYFEIRSGANTVDPGAWLGL